MLEPPPSSTVDLLFRVLSKGFKNISYHIQAVHNFPTCVNFSEEGVNYDLALNLASHDWDNHNHTAIDVHTVYLGHLN